MHLNHRDDQFPDFFTTRKRRIERDGTVSDSTGLSCLPIPIYICCFLDYSANETCVPFSGPYGDTVLSQRKEDAEIRQSFVY